MQQLRTDHLLERFHTSRALSEKITHPLAVEDYGLQAVEEVSPAKWHLAHTTWFYEEFILARWQEAYTFYLEDARKLFNSYYETLSRPFPRSKRGLISRPTVQDIFNYRRAVDERMQHLLKTIGIEDELQYMMELGIQHEQQHQELLMTDIKYNLSINPQEPVYHNSVSEQMAPDAPPSSWLSSEGGLVTVGTDEEHFSFDNERPAHKQYLYPYRLATAPVTNREFLAFIEDGGYQNPAYWLSDGWSVVQEEGWEAPLYWELEDQTHYTLGGRRPIPMEDPVRHVSFYEADAFARWAGARLPSEAEWEHVLRDAMQQAASLEETLDGTSSGAPYNTGYVWEWTSSPYTAYPQSARADGALGEYNMKFMSNQMVLRGGSAYTPSGHTRATYRNFFPPEKRWQCMGFRLARNGTE